MGFVRCTPALVAIALAVGGSSCLSGGASSSSSSKLLTEGGVSAKDSLAPLSVPNNVAPASDTGVSKLAVGVQHACAIRNGALACWGLNKHGQMANGQSGVIDGVVDPYTGSTYTVRIAFAPNTIFDSGVTDVAVGYEHSCAIRGDELFCWGSNEYGQLGLGASAMGTGKLYTSPVSVLKGVKQVSARGRWTCAVTSGQKLVCFGTRLADGTPKLVASSPKEILSGASAVSVSANHACAIVHSGADDSLWCFGMNSAGEVGNGVGDGLDVAAPFEVFSTGVSVVSVAENRSCAMVGGTMKCFGVTLGDREVDRTAGAWRVPSPTPYDSVFWAGIAPGSEISGSGSVLSSTGDLYYGSFFHGNGKPQKIALGASSFVFSENDSNACVMFRNHAVKCWGSDLFGQLGDRKRNKNDTQISQAVDVLF